MSASLWAEPFLVSVTVAQREVSLVVRGTFESGRHWLVHWMEVLHAVSRCRGLGAMDV